MCSLPFIGPGPVAHLRLRPLALRGYNWATQTSDSTRVKGEREGPSIRGAAAMVGIHEYKSRFDPEACGLQIQAESARRALEDAGLTKDDVDALYTHDARGITQ